MNTISLMFRRASVVALFFLSIIVLQEFSIRLALPEFNPSKHLVFSWHVDDLNLGTPYTVQRQNKNTGDFNVEVRFNRYGLRDSEDVSKAGPKDFLFVGDSFIFGWGVEENDRLGEKLGMLIGQQTYNAAVPGDLNTYADLVTYVGQITSSQPRTIISLSMETDILLYQAKPKRPAVITPDAKPSIRLKAIKEFLTQHSALYFLATSQVHKTAWLRDIAISFGLIQPNLQDRAARVPTPEAIASTVQRAKDLATEFDATIVIIPSRYTWFGPHRQELSAIHKTLTNALRAHGVDVLDLKPVFEEEGQPLAYHFKNDGHWQPIGHAKAAEALAYNLKMRFGNAL